MNIILELYDNSCNCQGIYLLKVPDKKFKYYKKNIYQLIYKIKDKEFKSGNENWCYDELIDRLIKDHSEIELIKSKNLSIEI